MSLFCKALELVVIVGVYAIGPSLLDTWGGIPIGVWSIVCGTIWYAYDKLNY